MFVPIRTCTDIWPMTLGWLRWGWFLLGPRVSFVGVFFEGGKPPGKLPNSGLWKQKINKMSNEYPSPPDLLFLNLLLSVAKSDFLALTSSTHQWLVDLPTSQGNSSVPYLGCWWRGGLHRCHKLWTFQGGWGWGVGWGVWQEEPQAQIQEGPPKEEKQERKDIERWQEGKEKGVVEFFVLFPVPRQWRVGVCFFKLVWGPWESFFWGLANKTGRLIPGVTVA